MQVALALDFQLRWVNAHHYPTSTGIELTNSNKNPTMLSDHDRQQLIDQVDAINWYHSIDLGNGVVTKGIDNSANKLSRLKFPESFDGLSVLDIGAWDGFFSFEAERRGASRVLSTDSFIWNGGAQWAGKAGYDLAKKTLGSKVEEKNIDVLDLSPEEVGEFDVTFFLGVLYHMKHPLLALERVSSVTKKMLILETAVDALWSRRPAMAFYPGSEVGCDPTNWCGPNPAAVIGMLKVVGFKRIEIVASSRNIFWRILKSAYHKLKKGHSFWQGIHYDRIAIHAYK